MKKVSLFVCALGLALVCAAGSVYADPTGSTTTDPGIGMTAPVDVNATLNQGAPPEAAALKVSGMMLFYYAVNFANPSSGMSATDPVLADNNNLLLPLSENGAFGLDAQLELAKEAVAAGEWGMKVKLDIGQRVAAIGGLELYVQEAWMSYIVSLGKASEGKVKLLVQAGRMESKLGVEKMDPEENAFLNYSILKSGLPTSGIGARANLSAMGDSLQLALALLNGDDNVYSGGGGMVEDLNNAKSVELMGSYKHKFTGSSNPTLKGQLGLYFGAEGAANTADKTIILDLIAQGGLEVSAKKLEVSLECVIGRSANSTPAGEDWKSLAATVTYAAHQKVDLGLRVEYTKTEGGSAILGDTDLFSIALNLTAKLSADGNLKGIVEFRHDYSSEGAFPTDDSTTTGQMSEDSQDTLTLAALLAF